jgi:hypothetical protein
MKSSSILLAALAASAFAFSPLALHAQDGPPPPPMDQGAPPPPDQQGGPPPPDGQGGPPPDGQGAPPDQGGDQGASFDEFYNNLSNDGQWIQTPDYGYAFQPAVQDPNWAPYTDGHWVYTAYGWTWASDEPWGWATYHYGRWVNIDGTGWCWIPGHQWAPAWVSWRYGGGYCGWAPLPPSSFVGVEFGDGVNFDFHFGSDCDTAYGIGPGWYNFIPIGFIGERGYRGHYYDRSRNFVIINNTRNITNININRRGRGTFGGVNAGGPNFAEVNRQSRTPVQQVRLAETRQAGRSTLSNGTLNVFAPRINGATAHQGRPANVSRTLSNVQINRGTSISQPLQVNSQFRGTAPSASAISAAREAEAHAPKGVATSTRVAPTVSAASVQQERTQSVQRQASQLHNAGNNNVGNTQNHTTGGNPQEHQFTGTPNAGNGGNTQAEHNNAQVEQHQQELRQQQNQQQNQQQEREAASQQQKQQHEQALRQQQQSAAQQQQHEEALRQQQVQQQQQVQHEQVFHQQQQPVQQQHSSPQPQEQHQSVPQQQHSSGGGNGGGGGGNGSGGNRGGGNGGGGGGGNGGGNHNGGNNNNNNNGQGQGH